MWIAAAVVPVDTRRHSPPHAMFRSKRQSTVSGLLRVGALAALAFAAVPTSSAAQHGLPSPRGAMRVGTAIRHLADSSRPDLVSRQAPRELVVQLWYPTDDTVGTRAPYVAPTVRDAMLAASYLRLDGATIARWGELRTHAIVDARVRGRDLPVLVLSHGQGISRSHYSALAEELASRGYLVAAVDHPYGGAMQRADGRVIALAQDPAAGPQDSVLAARVAEWAQDASFVLAQLRDARTPLGAVASAHASARAIGMLGHSLGGAAALEACRADHRFRACADLDGMLVGRVASDGPRGATLVVRSSPVYSEADLAKRGRTRAEWEAMGREVAAHFHDVAAKGAPGSVTLLRIRGTGHMSFSDAPYTFPEAITRFGGTPLDAERTRALVHDVVLRFFDAALRGGSRDALSALAAEAPEIEVERR
jgi:predicted dienelactone hydrolase